MKVWWVFAYDQYYPSAGLSDVKNTFATEEEAQAYVDELQSTCDYVRIVNVSDMLGL